MDSTGILGVDPARSVHEAEQVLGTGKAFGGPQHEEAGRLEGVMEDRKDLLLQHRTQIDQKISAGDEVEPREGWVSRHVLPGEDAHVPNGLRDLISTIRLDEESAQALRRNVRGDAFPVVAGAGGVDREVADVRPEDLDRDAARPVSEVLEEEDGDRIDLFARRAAGDPRAERSFARLLRENGRENGALERLERLRIPEEPGHVDEHVLVKGADLLGMRTQVLQVLPQPLDPVHHHAPLDPPLDRVLLVVREIHAVRSSQQLEDAVELSHLLGGELLVGERHGADVRMVGDPHELGRDPLRRQDEVDAPRDDRAVWHAPVLG